MAVAVFASTQDWTRPGRGLQLFGRCAEVAATELAAAEHIYARRFQAYTDWKASLEPGDPVRDYRFYRFAADRVKVLDEREFGDGVFVEADVARSGDG
jgi:hypothetical protein